MRWLGVLLFVAGLVLSFGNSGMFGATIEKLLQTSPSTIIPYISTLGTVLIWLGAGVFVLGLRRRNRVSSTASPTPSKWGRGN